MLNAPDDLDDAITALHKILSKLHDASAKELDPDRSEQLTSAQNDVLEELATLRAIRLARKAANVTVTALEPEEKDVLQNALTALDGVLRQEQAFNNLRQAVQTILDAAGGAATAAAPAAKPAKPSAGGKKKPAAPPKKHGQKKTPKKKKPAHK